jgi:nucleotide-binding universal stress UspA family protein
VRSRWLILALAFIGGLLLGLAVSVAIPGSALAGLSERWGPWGLVGHLAIVLIGLSISVAYGAWMIVGMSQFARPSDRTRAMTEIHEIPGSERMQHVLVATGGGPHAQLGLQLAAKVASGGEGELTLFRVVRPSDQLDTAAEAQELRHVAARILGPEPQVQTRVVASNSVVDAILEETRGGQYDLLVVGTSDEGTVRSLLFGTIPDAVAARTSCSVLIVRAATA